MAINACDPAVCARERKFRCRMVEASHFVPLRGCVTCLATGGRTIRPPRLHLRAEFTAMRILMADRASPILEFVLHRSHRTLRRRLMAVRARNRDVGAGQRETRLFVFGQSKYRGTPALIFQVVTCLAAIQRGRCGELSLVNILVTILAKRRGNPEVRVLTFRTFGDVAVVAGHFGMKAFQRILRGGMLLHAKCGGLPVIFRVARFAFAAIRTRTKLSMMYVLVTILALGMRHWRLEITLVMAIAASNRLVLSEQREFCFRVIETLHLRDASPACGAVATLAGPGEGALVHIDVAPCAFIEGESRVLNIRLRVLDHGMALYAVDFLVRAGKRIF